MWIKHIRKKITDAVDKKRAAWVRNSSFNRGSDKYWDTNSLKIKYNNIKSRISIISLRIKQEWFFEKPQPSVELHQYGAYLRTRYKFFFLRIKSMIFFVHVIYPDLLLKYTALRCDWDVLIKTILNLYNTSELDIAVPIFSYASWFN